MQTCQPLVPSGASSQFPDDLIAAEHERSLGRKLGIIEALQSDLEFDEIQCPGVLVIGERSAGKSSVLEGLTGIAFPTAQSACTKVPVIVQLQTDNSLEIPKAVVSKAADFSEGCTVCFSRENLREAIRLGTEDLGDENFPIRDRPIYIRYFRKEGPAMTLIDLPGINHLHTPEDSSYDVFDDDTLYDVHGVTASMVRKYVQNKNMIILVVIPANDDFCNSEALQIAQTYDQNGARTIGVVSKCDLVPEKSDFLQKVRMTRENDVKLALGFIAVRNRGPSEDELDMSATEDDLFSSHKLFRELGPEERGVEALSRKIAKLQGQTVNRSVLGLKSQVHNKISDVRTAIEEMPKIPKTSSERRALLSKGLCEMDAKLVKLVRAEDTSSSLQRHQIALRFAGKITSQMPDFLGRKTALQLERMSTGQNGYRFPSFSADFAIRDVVAETFFNGLLSSATAKLIDETVGLMDSTFAAIISQNSVLHRFEDLVCNIKEKFGEVLECSRRQVENLTNAILNAEKAQMFTQNPQHGKVLRMVEELTKKESVLAATAAEEREQKHIRRLGFVVQSPREDLEKRVAKLREELGAFESEPSSESETSLIELAKQCAKGEEDKSIASLQVAIYSYCNIIKQRVFDVIPMVTFHTVIHEVQRSFQCTMQESFTDDMLAKHMEEDLQLQLERQRSETRLQRMEYALRELENLT